MRFYLSIFILYIVHSYLLASEPLAIISKVRGKVKHKMVSDNKYRSKTKLNTPILSDMQIRTKSRSFSKISYLDDGTIISMYSETEIIIKLKNFLTSDELNLAIAEKFNLQLSDTYLDNGIQKYLDGYEISPHPDRKNKAATFMININPHKNSESLIHHTHYLKTKSEYSYVTNFWKNNPDVQRCWIPWDWCETNYVQSKNNSMVAFSPSEETLHAVKANYNHLAGQRTQLYGNLWHKKTKPLIESIEWENLDFKNKNISGKSNIGLKLSNALPSQVKKIYHKYILRDVDNIENIRDKKN